MGKSELCKMQFRAYLAWAKACSRDHCNFSYFLLRARELYGMYEFYSMLEQQPTEILDLKILEAA